MSTRRAKIIGLAWVAVAAAAAVAFSSGLTLLARAVPFSTEKKIAAAIDFTPKAPACANAAGEAALHKVVARIFPLEPGDNRIQIDVHAVHSPDVNAYAVLGGDIYVNQGLIEQAASPEELAGVLAHEIEHVRHRHVLQSVMVRLGTWGALELVLGDASSAADIAQMMLSLQYTKTQEHQADEGALKRLVKAEVSVQGFEDFFKRMRGKGPAGSELFSDHPSDTSRAQLAAQYAGHPSRPVLSGAEWKALRNICE